MSRVVDITGQRFGRLAVLNRKNSDSRGRATWWCECACGRRISVRGDALRSSLSTSCGKGECTAWFGVTGADHPNFGKVGELNGRWTGDAISYKGMHFRVRAERGPASEEACVDAGCGRPAQEWSYSGTSGEELVQVGGPWDGLRYSADPQDYAPRCIPCHRRFDKMSRTTPMEVVR